MAIYLKKKLSLKFFKNKSRKIFKKHINLDSDTWTCARGWALWKAPLITLAQLKDKISPEALKQRQIIDEILEEYVKAK